VEVTWREAKLMTLGERPRGETLGEMPRVVTLGERPRAGGNPWWETKVGIFGVMPRSR
jgi:hypothetical protein